MNCGCGTKSTPPSGFTTYSPSPAITTLFLKMASAGSRSTTEPGSSCTPAAAWSLASGLTDTLTFCGVVAVSGIATGRSGSDTVTVRSAVAVMPLLSATRYVTGLAAPTNPGTGSTRIVPSDLATYFAWPTTFTISTHLPPSTRQRLAGASGADGSPGLSLASTGTMTAVLNAVVAVSSVSTGGGGGVIANG